MPSSIVRTPYFLRSAYDRHVGDHGLRRYAQAGDPVPVGLEQAQEPLKPRPVESEHVSPVQGHFDGGRSGAEQPGNALLQPAPFLAIGNMVLIAIGTALPAPEVGQKERHDHECFDLFEQETGSLLLGLPLILAYALCLHLFAHVDVNAEAFFCLLREPVFRENAPFFLRILLERVLGIFLLEFRFIEVRLEQVLDHAGNHPEPAVEVDGPDEGFQHIREDF